jgi:hypothetical protein
VQVVTFCVSLYVPAAQSMQARCSVGVPGCAASMCVPLGQFANGAHVFKFALAVNVPAVHG